MASLPTHSIPHSRIDGIIEMDRRDHRDGSTGSSRWIDGIIEMDRRDRWVRRGLSRPTSKDHAGNAWPRGGRRPGGHRPRLGITIPTSYPRAATGGLCRPPASGCRPDATGVHRPPSAGTHPSIGRYTPIHWPVLRCLVGTREASGRVGAIERPGGGCHPATRSLPIVHPACPLPARRGTLSNAAMQEGANPRAQRIAADVAKVGNRARLIQLARWVGGRCAPTHPE